jgi:hypothetical protein
LSIADKIRKFDFLLLEVATRSAKRQNAFPKSSCQGAFQKVFTAVFRTIHSAKSKRSGCHKVLGILLNSCDLKKV